MTSSKSIQVSGIVITYNEAEYIEQCLCSLQRVTDEIIVVDSFSSDDTPRICRNFGVRLFFHQYVGQIEQKKFALSKASYEYVLSIDGDEVLSDKLIKSILAAKESGFPDHGYEMNRLTHYSGQWIKHGGWYPDWKLRLWNKTQAYWGGMNPHDTVTLKTHAKPSRLTGDLLHYAFDSVSEHLLRIESYANITSEAAYNHGRKSSLFLIVFNPVWKFIRDYFLKLGFLDGRRGFLIACISAKSKRLKYRKLYELQRRGR